MDDVKVDGPGSELAMMDGNERSYVKMDGSKGKNDLRYIIFLYENELKSSTFHCLESFNLIFRCPDRALEFFFALNLTPNPSKKERFWNI